MILEQIDILIEEVDDAEFIHPDGLKWAKTNENKIKKIISKKMLALYNTSWREDDPKINNKQFESRIKLSIVYKSEVQGGDINVYFTDGDLFLGHSIEAVFDKNKKLVTIGLAG